MTDRRTIDYIAYSAYDQGVEDGVKQERERIVALLDDFYVEKRGDGKRVDEYHMGVVGGIYLSIQLIGLGAVTTEESEYE